MQFLTMTLELESCTIIYWLTRKQKNFIEICYLGLTGRRPDIPTPTMIPEALGQQTTTQAINQKQKGRLCGTQLNTQLQKKKFGQKNMQFGVMRLKPILKWNKKVASFGGTILAIKNLD